MEYEAMIQQQVVQYCDLKKIPIYAIPNGGKRDAKEAYFMKLSGVKSGVPDLCVPIAAGGYHGLYVEMKYGKNKPTVNQKKWLSLLSANGYKCVVCYSFDEARRVIDTYTRAKRE